MWHCVKNNKVKEEEKNINLLITLTMKSKTGSPQQ